jgi:signal transduction histidine kinase
MTAAAALTSERLSILVVEDNVADVDLVREMLVDAGPVAAGAVAPEVHHVETLRQALAAAGAPYDVVLIDLGLPDASGLEALESLHAAAPDLPAVVLTGTRDLTLGARALVSGAQDFLVKGDVEGELLLRSLRFAVARHQHAIRVRQLAAEQAARAAAEALQVRAEALAQENSRLFDEARDAVHARDEFISVASHELRTPLATLQLAICDLARVLDAEADDPAARRLRAATRSVERLTRLVETLLDLSRLRSGGFRLAREPFDLRGAALAAIEQLRDPALAAGCDLRIDAPAPVLGCWDRTAIERVVVNLLDNAVKYAPGKPVHLEVASRGRVATITVRDGGTGIAPESAARIFDRFERGPPTPHRPGGLGLGLYITRHLVEVHGGRIHVESSPGAGSAFTIRLPLEPGVDSVEKPPGPVSRAS